MKRLVALLALVPLLVGTAVPAGNASTYPAPVPGGQWQWQLAKVPTQAQLDALPPEVTTVDVDGEDATAAIVAAIEALPALSVCYFSAGSWEDWRSDAVAFPAAVLGKSNGWPGEKWLDVRAISTLEPIMRARLQMCADKGFDAVEPDNVDGYENRTGFPITYADQIAYNTAIAGWAHDLGLGVALKNDAGQVDDLVHVFDFAVVEECAKWNECDAYSPFIAAGKAVLAVEYLPKADPAVFCPELEALGFDAMAKKYALNAYRAPC